MRIGQNHGKLVEWTRNFCLEALASGPVPAMVTQALRDSGLTGAYPSPLHPAFVLWLVIGLMVWRSDSIPAVFGRLVSGMRAWCGDLSLKAVTDGALAHARKRLGVNPLRRLFRALGACVDPRPTFFGLRVWIIDGVHFTLLDTPENLRVFGRRTASRGRTAFCELTAVCLVDATRHLIRDAVFGLWNRSEVEAARRLVRHFVRGDLVILDRLYYCLPLFRALLAREAHFLCRVRSNVKLRAIRGTCRGCEYDAWMTCQLPWEPGETRTGWGQTRVVRLRVRVLDYRLPGHQRVRLVTSLMDRALYPATEVALLYHRRWEAEIAFDEIKTHQNANAHGQIQTTFRSKTPRNVMQEAFALLVAYNLVRRTMAEAAEDRGLDPRRLSFLDSLRAVQWMTPRMQAAPTRELPALYRQLLADVTETRLDRFRRPRRYPRVVRVKMSKFKLKRPRHRQDICDFDALVRRVVA
jgi:hypothetical protein